MALNQRSSITRWGLCATILTAVAIFAVALVFSAPVHAQSLDAAKAAGQVVERADGLLSACPGAPASVSGLVESINAKRLKHYEGIAANTPDANLTQVQAVAGAKLRQSSPGGCK